MEACGAIFRRGIQTFTFADHHNVSFGPATVWFFLGLIE